MNISKHFYELLRRQKNWSNAQSGFLFGMNCSPLCILYFLVLGAIPLTGVIWLLIISLLAVLTEATFEVLPRLNEIKFGSGVLDELLFLDMPKEVRFPSGIMVLEYGKAVQESVYEQLRVVREGQLRITFANDLKVIHQCSFLKTMS